MISPSSIILASEVAQRSSYFTPLFGFVFGGSLHFTGLIKSFFSGLVWRFVFCDIIFAWHGLCTRVNHSSLAEASD
jgi:hypothetical protein